MEIVIFHLYCAEEPYENRLCELKTIIVNPKLQTYII